MKKILSLLLLIILFAIGIYFFIDKYNEIPEFYQCFNEDGVNFDRETLSNELENKYYYKQLNNVEKILYESMYYASKDYKNYFEYTFEVPNDEDINRAREAFVNDFPLYYWWNDIFYTENKYISNSFGKKFYYNETRSSLHDDIDFDNIIDLLNNKANEILDQCKDDDDYLYIKNIHDYLITNVIYNELALNEHAILGPLLNGQSVCDGYAYSFQLLTNMAGFDCITVIGTTVNSKENETHAWNIINIDNAWYHVDVTWDDLDYEDSSISYRYFLINDQYMEIDHTLQKKFIMPKCNDLNFYYYNMPGIALDSFNKSEISLFISNWLKKGKKTYEIVFLNNSDYKKASAWLYNGQGLVEIYRNYYDAYSGFVYGYNYLDEGNYIQAYYQ